MLLLQDRRQLVEGVPHQPNDHVDEVQYLERNEDLDSHIEYAFRGVFSYHHRREPFVLS